MIGDDADTGALSYVGLAEETTTHRVSVALCSVLGVSEVLYLVRRLPDRLG